MGFIVIVKMDTFKSMSQKGAGLIMKSVTGAPYVKPKSKAPPPMTPSAKKVFHLMTSMDDPNQSKRRRDSVKHGIHQLSVQAIDSTWTLNEDWVINPRSHVRKLWDFLITVLVFYLISMLPWELGVNFYVTPKGINDFETFLGNLPFLFIII